MRRLFYFFDFALTYVRYFSVIIIIFSGFTYSLFVRSMVIMSGENKIYYHCAVPKCVNTSTNQPKKKIFSSPSDAKRRTWMKKMRREPKDLSSKTTFFVCEDHFNVSINSLVIVLLHRS